MVVSLSRKDTHVASRGDAFPPRVWHSISILCFPKRGRRIASFNNIFYLISQLANGETRPTNAIVSSVVLDLVTDLHNSRNERSPWRGKLFGKDPSAKAAARRERFRY